MNTQNDPHNYRKLGRILLIGANLCLPFVLLILVDRPATLPKGWERIQVGEQIQDVQQRVPSIHVDRKDGGLQTWYVATTATRWYGIKFLWHMDIQTDSQGKILSFEGRSYNAITGVLDRKF